MTRYTFLFDLLSRNETGICLHSDDYRYRAFFAINTKYGKITFYRTHDVISTKAFLKLVGLLDDYYNFTIIKNGEI